MNDVLAALYGGAPAAPGIDPFRWRLERERRVIDIQAQLQRYAPLAMSFGHALLGEEFSQRIMKGLAAAARLSPEIYDAAIHSLHTLVGTLGDERVEIALAHDAAKAGDMRSLRAPTAHEEEMLTRAGLGGALLLDRSWRFGAFFTAIQRLVAAQAPGEHLKRLELEPGRQIYAYVRGTTRRIADVTEAFGEAGGGH